MSVSHILREMLDSGRWRTMTELAADLQMSKGGLSRLIRDERGASFVTVVRIADLSGRPLEDFAQMARDGDAHEPSRGNN